jgi:hypothetical protein
MDNIDILLVYLSNEGREVYLYDILSMNDAMDATHYQPSGYWNAYGGLEIVVNNYNTILHLTDFSYLLKVTDFLLHSLYWLANKKADWFEEYEPDRIVLRTTKGDSVVLQKRDLNKISISFLSSGKEYVRNRGDKFFENFLIDVTSWIESVNIALSEYFKILVEFVLSNTDDPMKFTSLEYLTLWENIKSK